MPGPRSPGSVRVMVATGGARKSLPLILARELASNLATPMFLMDASGTLVFYNDAAELLIGRPFAELGEIASEEFGRVLELRDARWRSASSPRHAGRDRVLRAPPCPPPAQCDRVRRRAPARRGDRVPVVRHGGRDARRRQRLLAVG